MKIKVCGLRESENINEIIKLNIDYIGYIFYDKSPRNVTTNPKVEVPQHIQKVGVFVNETIENITNKVIEYGLNLVQLHGDENPDFCNQLKQRGMKIIKAFSVGEGFQFELLNHYKPFCDYFLFDSRGQLYGGNGTVFNWHLLKKYDNEIPYFLSGGISLQHIDRILATDYLNIAGIDVNSKFEESPGVKNVNEVAKLVKQIRKHESVSS